MHMQSALILAQSLTHFHVITHSLTYILVCSQGTHMHAHARTFIHMYIYTHTMYLFIYSLVFTYTHVFTYTLAYIHTITHAFNAYDYLLSQ